MERHLILTVGRSGSNTLVDLLNQNPQVLNFGEALGEWTRARRTRDRLGFRRGDDAAYLDALLDERPTIRVANAARNVLMLARRRPGDTKRLSRVRTVGLKEFSLNFSRFGIADYARARPDLKVIGLVRSDIVDRYLSYKRLAQTGAVSSRDAAARGGRIMLDPETLAEELETIARENAELSAMLADATGGRARIVDYADLFSAPERTREICGALFDFLGVAPVAPEVRMTKIIRTPPSGLVANFEACKAALAGTRFEAAFV